MKLPLHFLTLVLLSQQSSIRVDVNLQEVRLSVYDGGGAAISTLTARDFVVEENGVRQEEVSVSHDTETPISYGVLLKASGPMDMRTVLGNWSIMDAAKAAIQELTAQMKPQDEMVLMTFAIDNSLVVAQDFTDQKSKIEEVMQTIKPCCSADAMDLSAILPLAIEKLRTSKYRNRVLIVIDYNFRFAKPNVGPAGIVKMQKLQGQVDALEVPVYAISVSGDARHPDGRFWASGTEFEMQHSDEFYNNPFMEETGGHAFHFDFNALRSTKLLSRLRAFIQQLNMDLRSRYLLTYHSQIGELSPRQIRVWPVSPDYRFRIVRAPLQFGDPQGGTNTQVAIAAGVTPSEKAALQGFRDADFVRIPAGEFQMGCAQTDSGCFPTDFGQLPRIGIPRPNDARLNPWKVRIRKSFELGKYEVTQAQWESLMGTNPSYFRGADRPVEMVSWNDVQEFLKKLNARKDGYRYRLPSEEEWEYAARAGKSGPFEGMLETSAWIVDNSDRRTHPVGTRKPNAWGLYDMYGNVFEWMEEWNLDQPRDFSAIGAGNYFIEGPPTRRIRGGSWFSTAVFSRTSYLMGQESDRRLSTLGFRIVREK